jgi:hypothetical protein
MNLEESAAPADVVSHGPPPGTELIPPSPDKVVPDGEPELQEQAQAETAPELNAEVMGVVAPMVDGLRTDFANLGESPETMFALQDWLKLAAAGTAPAPGKHEFDVQKWRGQITAADQDRLASFLGFMHMRGASQSAVDSSLRWFMELRAAQGRGALAGAFARAAGGARTTLATPGRDPGAESEIAAIERTMRENRKAYNADTDMQRRYRELLSRRDAR